MVNKLILLVDFGGRIYISCIGTFVLYNYFKNKSWFMFLTVILLVIWSFVPLWNEDLYK